jgi:hypothetical protein
MKIGTEGRPRAERLKSPLEDREVRLRGLSGTSSVPR